MLIRFLLGIFSMSGFIYIYIFFVEISFHFFHVNFFRSLSQSHWSKFVYSIYTIYIYIYIYIVYIYIYALANIWSESNPSSKLS